MSELQHLLPSVTELSQDMFDVVRSTLSTGTRFNYGQLVQGENIAHNVAQLQASVRDRGEECLKFYLFALVCLMSGLTGTVTLDGSLFLNEQNALALLLG